MVALTEKLMQRRLKIGVLYSRVRVEEKWIFNALEKRGIDFDRLDDRAVHFDLENAEPWKQYDAVIERSISYTSGLYALRILNGFDVLTINSAAVAEACGDKLTTSTLLTKAGLPQPRNVVAFTPESALEALEELGYPAVVNRWLGRGDVCWQRSMIGMRLKRSSNIKPRWVPRSIRFFIYRSISISRAAIFALLSLVTTYSRRCIVSPNIGLRILRGVVRENYARSRRKSSQFV